MCNPAFTLDSGLVPKRISVVLCDVTDTITAGDKLDDRLASLLIELIDSGIRFVFVSGRDRTWLAAKIINPLKEVAKEAGRSLAHATFDAELGLVVVDTLTRAATFYGDIYGTPFMNSITKKKIADLFWQTKDLKSFDPNTELPVRHYIVHDANGEAYQMPMFPTQSVIFGDFIWSESKEMIATAEAIRDQDLNVPVKVKQKIGAAAKIIDELLKYMDIQDVIVVPCGTAIDFIPTLNKAILDKSWAAGRYLESLSASTGKSVSELAAVTIGIGDGVSDLRFTAPQGDQAIEVPLAFVGPHDLRVGAHSAVKIFAEANNGSSGPVATYEILKWLKDAGVFQPL